MMKLEWHDKGDVRVKSFVGYLEHECHVPYRPASKPTNRGGKNGGWFNVTATAKLRHPSGMRCPVLAEVRRNVPGQLLKDPLWHSHHALKCVVVELQQIFNNAVALAPFVGQSARGKREGWAKARACPSTCERKVNAAKQAPVLNTKALAAGRRRCYKHNEQEAMQGLHGLRLRLGGSKNEAVHVHDLLRAQAAAAALKLLLLLFSLFSLLATQEQRLLALLRRETPERVGRQHSCAIVSAISSRIVDNAEK